MGDLKKALIEQESSDAILREVERATTYRKVMEKIREKVRPDPTDVKPVEPGRT